MTEQTPIELELIEVSGFRAAKRYANRQDYLASLARAIEQVDDDDFETLSDEAADWYDAAAKAININDKIPEFPDLEDEAEEEEAEDGDVEEEESDDEEAETDEAEGETDESEASGDDDEAEEPEPEPAPARKAKGQVNGKAVAKAKEAEKPAKPEKAPKAKAKAKKPEPQSEDEKVEVIAKLRAKDKEKEKAKKGGKALPHTRYDEVSGRKNRYGYYEGTKTDEAIKMFEKGAKMSEVNEYLGDTFYNLIKKLREAGHSVIKNDNGQFVLKHKDDIGGKPAAAPRKAKAKNKE